MLNTITIMGRLVKDPDLRHTANEIAVCSVRLAVDRDVERDKCDFIDVVAWRQTAEFLSRYFHKGDLCVASGRLQMRDWTDKDGNKRTAAEVVCDKIYFGSSKKSIEKISETDADDDDGDLPF